MTKVEELVFTDVASVEATFIGLKEVDAVITIDSSIRREVELRLNVFRFFVWDVPSGLSAISSTRKVRIYK